MSWHGYTPPSDWARLRRSVLKEELHVCYLCSCEASSVDHVVPVSQGGTHDRSNLRAVCEACHTTKSKAEAAYGSRRWAETKAKEKRQTPRPPGLL